MDERNESQQPVEEGKRTLDAQEIWRRFQAIVQQHQTVQLKTRSEICHNFFEGDQWHGMKSGGEQLPQMNIISPICLYKIATVCMNDTAIIFSAMDGDPRTNAVCVALTDYARKNWERMKMDQAKWQVVEDVCVTGDHYVYVFAEDPGESVYRSREPRLKMRMIDRTAIFLEDEQEADLNEQDYIIIAERSSVAKLRLQARRAGLTPDEVEQITGDEDTEQIIGETTGQEVKTDLGKCTSLLYMQKVAGGVEFCRCCKNVIYQPMQLIRGLSCYPVAGMRWKRKKGSARGIGNVEPLLANQMEINKTLARRALVVKKLSYPTMVYNETKVSNPEGLNKVGSAVRVRGNVGTIKEAVDILTPPGMNADAASLEAELINKTRELEGAGEAATGQVDVTKTSGEAIKAARDQSALIINNQAANYKQFVEDFARILAALRIAYTEGGMSVSWQQENEDGTASKMQEMIPQEELLEMEINVRIDVSPADPYSVLSREVALGDALARGYITFEEYVDSLDDNSGIPKDRFKAILARRKQALQSNTIEEPRLQQPGSLPDELSPELMMQMIGGEGV